MTINEELRSVFEGHFVSLLCYGATGSGKTFTLTSIAERLYAIVFSAICAVWE